jgi:hypothetical protein
MVRWLDGAMVWSVQASVIASYVERRARRPRQSTPGRKLPQSGAAPASTSRSLAPGLSRRRASAEGPSRGGWPVAARSLPRRKPPRLGYFGETFRVASSTRARLHRCASTMSGAFGKNPAAPRLCAAGRRARPRRNGSIHHDQLGASCCAPGSRSRCARARARRSGTRCESFRLVTARNLVTSRGTPRKKGFRTFDLGLSTFDPCGRPLAL